MWEQQGRGSFGTWGWGRLCALPARRDPGLQGRTAQTRPGSPAVPGIPLDKLCICPVPRAAWMWSHDVMHLRDATLRSWTRAGLRSRSCVILAALGSGHLVTVHRIARQR